MKEYRNPELRLELIIYICITAVCAGAALFISPWAAVCVLAAGAAITAVHRYMSVRRYRRIAELGGEIDRILHGQDSVLIEGSDEGELAILESEIRKMTVRLREQTDRLQQDKLQLTDAIADIFHQLRTPITSMNLAASMLGTEELAYADRVRLTRDLKRQLERVTWLVETLLKMSRIDSGTAEFKREDIAAGELIRLAAEPFVIPMELRGQELKVRAEGVDMNVDRAWTVEALGNLLKNCMEHTPEGGTITVTAGDTVLYTQITVEDTGEGFVPEDIPHLFERYYKGKNASEGSIGIGLAFARMIAAAQDGTLTAENRPEGGARFILKFYKSVV